MNTTKLAAESAGTDETTLQNAFSEHKELTDQYRDLGRSAENIVALAFELRNQMAMVDPRKLDEFVSKIAAVNSALDQAINFTKSNN